MGFRGRPSSSVQPFMVRRAHPETSFRVGPRVGDSPASADDATKGFAADDLQVKRAHALHGRCFSSKQLSACCGTNWSRLALASGSKMLAKACSIGVDTRRQMHLAASATRVTYSSHQASAPSSRWTSINATETDVDFICGRIVLAAG